MKYIVDAIEDGFAILSIDKNRRIQVKTSDLPGNIREGDVISFNGNTYSFCEEETKNRRKKLFDKQKAIFNRK